MLPRTGTELIHISIHAPREGGDSDQYGRIRALIEISIHAPREGGDVDSIGVDCDTGRFQSTPPARGATQTDKRGDRR